MRTLVTADLHLSSNPRDSYRHVMLKRLVRDATKLDVGQTLILGDLTEEKDRHSDWLVNRVVSHIRRFSALGPVYINQGNHDYLSNPQLPFFYFLRELPHVHWIRHPTHFTLAGLGRVLFLPHTRNYKRDWKGVDMRRMSYIFAHCTVERTDLGGRIADTGIPLSTFPRNTPVISGDVHIPQTVGQVTYVGAPYTIDFGDIYGARVLLLEQGKEPLSVLMDGPQKWLIEYKAPRFLDLVEGDIVKVRVPVKRSTIANWPKLRDQARAWAIEQGCKVHSIQPVIQEDQASSKKRIRRAEVKSDQQVMEEFAKLRGIDQRMLIYGERFL